ncbi:MAG TPA: DUF1501 domain-containing protein [Pirellulales bacterium]|jgi:hypothetical protein|nr:DUF1501 domain-containing protein [Pirellulales bacterium]
MDQVTRRGFLKTSLATAAVSALPRAARAGEGLPLRGPARAEHVIFIWLPGGVAQQDTWDWKAHTPFEKGMRGSQLLGTCPSIPTAVDGLRFGVGLENLASVMHRGTLLRSLTNETKFGAVHLKAQYYMMTGHLFPQGVRVPGIGAVIGRTLGPVNPQVPPYIYIGRDIDTTDTEKQFISEYIGPGFYGVRHAPFMIPDPTRGMATLEAAAGVSLERLNRRIALLEATSGGSSASLRSAGKVDEYLRTMHAAREMMDSPVKRAFSYAKEETPATLAAYEPQIGPNEVLDKRYYFGQRFGHGLLLARRLVEHGARFVQVEYQYGPFRGFDMHENGALRMVEMKKQIDGPISQLIRDLDQRGLLDRTLVVIATEFGRTIANQPKAGVEPIGFAESQSGEDLVIENETMYGHHGHFSSGNSLLFFGGGFKPGLVYGRTADRHPMVATENPVSLPDVHATIYKALGIPADTYYVTEGRPVHVTKDGKGRAIDALLA